MWPFNKLVSKTGYASVLLALKREAEDERGYLKQLVNQAWEHAKQEMAVAAKKACRQCKFELTFEGVEGGNNSYIPEVRRHLHNIALHEGIMISQVGSDYCRDTRASW